MTDAATAEMIADSSSSGLDIAQLIGMAVAVITVLLAIAQLRAGIQQGTQTRLAELSWSIYGEYSSPKLRKARSVAERLARTLNMASGQDYKALVADPTLWEEGDFGGGSTDDQLVRDLLRFYNQVAILTRSKVIDRNFVIELLGPGLVTGWPALSASIDYYQTHYLGSTGTSSGTRRAIYDDVSWLYGIILNRR